MSVDNIGRYRIAGELGKGAMGVVYKATDPNIGRTVALKTLRLDLEGTEAEELLRRFKNEARAAGVLNHPNIVTIYDAGEHSGMFYIAMEFIEGETLQQVLKRERILEVERAVQIVRQLCAGLDFAHSKGIIHRDIKPANVMLEPDGTAKIMDFGIAKGVGGGLTSTGQVLGTPNYMSPEQVKGGTLDGRSDLFSLGVVLYEMLTGERPFSGQNVTTIIYKIINEHPLAPRDLDMTFPAGLSATVMKALAKAPQERYQSGAELARDLQNYKSLGEAARAAVPPPQATGDTVDIAPTAMAAAAYGVVRKPAPVPSLQSTVTVPQRREVVAPPQKKSPAVSGALIAVAAVALALGGYFGMRSLRSAPKQPPAAVETAKPVPPEIKPGPPKPEAQPAASPETAAPAAEAAVESKEAAPDTGELRVTSSPTGALVKIDGRGDPKWLTPFTAPKLKPGGHTVSFAKEGYQPATRKVEIRSGAKAAISADLQTLPAFIAVSTDPAGAHILVDGADTGQLTPAKLAVTPGQHRVAVRKEGFRPEAAVVDAGAGQTLSLAPQLKPAGAAEGGRLGRLKRWLDRNPQDKGVLEIRTRPKGAQIWVNDTLTPGKTPVKVPVPPGKYRITLRLPGFKPVVRNIEIEKGKTRGIDEIFEKQ